SIECTVNATSLILEDPLSPCASLILVFVFRNIRRSRNLDVCLRQNRVVFLRKREGADRDDSLSALQAVGDLNRAHVSDTDLYLLLVRLVIRIENNYRSLTVRAGQKRLGWNHDRVRNGLRHNL